MARVLWCKKCQSHTGALVIEKQTLCPDCKNPVEWKEVGFVLTKDDRLFLKQMHIRPED